MPDSIISLYQRHSEEWDRLRGRSLFERPWLDRFLALIGPAPEIIDLGCGSGEPLAAYLIGRGVAMTGIDSAPALIALCRQRFAAHRWIVADMRALPVTATFDGILAWDSFFHLNHDDQRRMFASFGRLAKPGAPLLFTSGPSHGKAIGNMWGEPVYHASLSSDEYHARLSENGFTVIDHRIEDPECGKHTVWLARRLTDQA
ncbi:class I SAM-dependent DNA methyltransferase [Magnetospirillum sulfuroxidans]|uniref:Class I SAM-dependent methyltransferase n=1 Tax=Magnetospirillum sulfuroxidans TaxID=611300 RepID=A0ABS5I709_9PROT|nr:class I SAM-dependent methyltransferase [Magnetospirillum sulfuroxidans]MBR9970202.1 class I SAM-dependent methyltransferase [Magnetospirillum sulfuroxidans]